MRLGLPTQIKIGLGAKITAATMIAINFALVFYIFLLQADLTAIDRQLSLQQSLIRQRDYIYFLAALTNTYITEEAATTKHDFHFVLEHAGQELQELENLLPESAENKKYMKAIYSAFKSYRHKAIACQEQLQEQLSHAATLQAFSRATQNLLQELISPSDAAGVPLMMSTAKVKTFARLAADLNATFLCFLGFNIALMLALFVYVIFGNKSLAAYFTSSASLSQKVNFLIVTPLIFQLCFIALLHIMFELSQASIVEMGKARLIDIKLEQLTADITETIRQSGLKPFAAGQKNKLQLEINDLKRLSTHDAQQIHTLKLIEKLLSERQSLLDKTSSDDTSFSITGQKDLIADIWSQSITRLIYLARPNRGGDVLYKEREFIVGKTARSAKLAQNFLLAGTGLTISLSLFILWYMNLSLSDRFKTITDNILRRSKNEPLLPPLTGSDDLAQVDHFFHSMVTKIEESHRQEKAVIENATDIICTLDSRLRFISANPAIESHWGYERNEILETSMLDLVLADDRQNTEQACRTLITRNTPLLLENSIRKKDGDYTDALWSMQQSEDLIFCVVRDISERKQIERFKQQFLSMISHDLRTPITTILVGIELMSAGALGEFTPEGSAKLLDSRHRIKNVLSLINDLLDLEKMEAGQMHFDITDIDLTLILDAVMIEAQSAAAKRNIRVDGSLDELRTLADKDRITRALLTILNFICNRAPDFSPVWVNATCGDNTIAINITDQGKKIPAAELSGLFELFASTQEISNNSLEENILGLPLSATILKLHGGSIAINSTDEKTIWTITLPTPDYS